jgi:hypothetical protein
LPKPATIDKPRQRLFFIRDFFAIGEALSGWAFCGSTAAIGENPALPLRRTAPEYVRLVSS